MIQGYSSLRKPSFQDNGGYGTGNELFKDRKKEISAKNIISSHWSLNGMAVGLILFGIWGPIAMLISTLIGAVIGYTASLVYKFSKNKQKKLQLISENRALENLLRWAWFQMTYSSDKERLTFSIILEIEHLKNKGIEVTKSGYLNYFQKFLSRKEVGHCLWNFLNQFFNNWDELTRIDVAFFKKICLTCLWATEGMTENIPEIIIILRQIINIEVVHSLLNLKELFSEPLESHSQNLKSANQDIGSFGVRSDSLDHSEIAILRYSSKVSFNMSVEEENEESQTVQADISGSVDNEIFEQDTEESKRLFHSFKDFLDFDSSLKHITPIADYELCYLEQLERMDDPSIIWESVHESSEIKVFKTYCGKSSVVMVKALAQFVDIPKEILFQQIYDVKLRKNWDTNFSDMEIVADEGGCEIIYSIIKAPFPIANRDFVQYRKVHVKENEIIIMMRSAVHPKTPVKSENVRAESIISGYIIRGDSLSSQIFIVSQTDVKGIIPKWLISSLSVKIPINWVEKLKDASYKYIKFGMEYQSISETQMKNGPQSILKDKHNKSTQEKYPNVEPMQEISVKV